MRKNWRSKWLVIVWLLLLIACSGEKHAEHTDTYTCPMHPTVVSDRPGTCPVCGMDLVRKSRPGEEVQITEDLARLIKSPNEVVMANISTVKGEFKSITTSLDVNGRVTYDTRSIYTIPSRIAGRLEKVYLKYAYQHVSKGEKVAEVYSPEVQTAQRELTYLLENDSSNSQLIQSARSKLSLLGAAPSQSPTFVIHSPYEGYVIGDELAREGDYVATGQTLFKVVNTSALRVELNIPIMQSASIKVDDVIRLNIGEKTVQAKVDLVQPFLDANEEFVKVRVNINNMNFNIGTLVKASIELKTAEALWLPKDAVLDLGLGQIVFVKERASFQPKKVEAGIRAGDVVEIRRGLVSSDEVASNAQYLVDSESFIATNETSRDQVSERQMNHDSSARDNKRMLMFTDTQIRLANITTQKATMKPMGRTIALNGTIRSDETRREVISSRTAGRIEKLYFKETGRPVKKGQPLYDVYSEALITLQKEYLLAREQYETLGKDQARYASYVKAAERKLLLYGLTQPQVDQLAQSKKVENTMTFLAPTGGTIAEISAAEGQYVEEGAGLYKIDDVSRLWVEADMYPNELPAIKPGDKVKVNISGYESSPVEATITFVSPEYRAGSQITVVRASISNTDGKFVPGMQAQVMLTQSSRKALSIPVDAVIRDGKGMHVYVQTDVNAFEPRMVKTGVEDFEQVEIIEGISENEVIAVTGTYLLYSEFKNQNRLPL